MPVRSLTSSVLRWPDRDQVVDAVTAWAREVVARDPTVIRVGYFGSYATGTWGVGSDLDLVIIVGSTDLPFERRAIAWDTMTLPVPTDLLVYTPAEWERLNDQRHPATTETCWVEDLNAGDDRGRRQHARLAVGGYRSGHPDTSEAHDAAFAERRW